MPACLIADSDADKNAAGDRARHPIRHGGIPRYTLATKLVNELIEAADDNQLAKTISRYRRVDQLCIDELGHTEVDKRGVGLPVHVLAMREEKASVAIASNESFIGL